MRSAPPRYSHVRDRPRQGRSARGWLTLLVLIVVAAFVSLGPGTLRELIAGLTFARPAAASIAPAPSHADANLQSRVASVVDSRTHGQMAAAAVDLQSGATADIDAQRAYPAASLFKLPIMLEVLAEEDAGQLDP